MRAACRRINNVFLLFSILSGTLPSHPAAERPQNSSMLFPFILRSIQTFAAHHSLLLPRFSCCFPSFCDCHAAAFVVANLFKSFSLAVQLVEAPNFLIMLGTCEIHQHHFQLVFCTFACLVRFRLFFVFLVVIVIVALTSLSCELDTMSCISLDRLKNDPSKSSFLLFIDLSVDEMRSLTLAIACCFLHLKM